MPASRQDLVDALRGVAQGNTAAFEEVYLATSMKLYGIVIRILGRGDVADEVLQDVYMRVWQRAKDFEPELSSPITWLSTIARNRALDEARRQSPRSLEEYPELLNLPGLENIAADHEKNDELRRLHSCLNRLDHEKREILLLVYYHGMTRAEVAGRINRPVATVKTWLRRSLADLKDCLGK